ncbi:MAG TPA: hypothetical protein VGB25_08780 [Candidatus Binatia bacterium]
MTKRCNPWWKVLLGALVILLANSIVGKTHAFTRILEYTDNKYNYSFQFPSNWKTQQIAGEDDFGEIRVLLQGPRASSIMVLVDALGKSVNRSEFLKDPNQQALVTQMVNFTIDQTYRKSSKRMSASKMIVVEKQIRPSNVGIKYYISTLHYINGIPLGLAGIHTIPFGQDHVIGFLMSSILDEQTMENNATYKRIFNSFHLIGEGFAPPPGAVGGVVNQVANWVPVVGEMNWQKSLADPVVRKNLFLWVPGGLLLLLALRYAKGRRRRRGWHTPVGMGKFR